MLNRKGNGEVVAIGFAAGFVGAAAVLVVARLLFYAGIGPALRGLDRGKVNRAA